MMEDRCVSLAHGNGGRLMRQLIEEVFRRHLDSGLLNVDLDAVPVSLSAGQVLLTTDGFTVNPLEFPGGNIGSLAVHGTVNDLSVSGAVPRYLTLNAFIEEGLELEKLDRIVAGLGDAARQCGVQVVAGDTKVVGKGEGGGLYLATTGVGTRDPDIRLGPEYIEAGDAILVSGPVGDHGTAVMLAREQFGMRGDLASDSASVFPVAQSLLSFNGLRFMRDPTRGGVATVMHEIERITGLGIRLREPAIPVRDPVRSVCDMLGYDPLYLACEGRLIAVIDAGQAPEALARLQQTEGGANAALIGMVEAEGPVVVQTEFGGERILQELEDDPLPRIC
jgi:hydrogenase expression/formation protein HypE